eukprot:1034706-Pyramimonas_sp.AAC.1
MDETVVTTREDEASEARRNLSVLKSMCLTALSQPLPSLFVAPPEGCQGPSPVGTLPRGSRLRDAPIVAVVRAGGRRGGARRCRHTHLPKWLRG